MGDATPEPRNPERLELEELTSLQPGLARLMPEVAARFWKCFYAARAANWPLASWQLREMRKLFNLGTITRPKYKDDVDEYLREEIEPLFEAVEKQDLSAFSHHFSEATDSANEWHRRWKKGYILWKLPESPPQDLVLTPQTSE